LFLFGLFLHLRKENSNEGKRGKIDEKKWQRIRT